MKNSLPGFARYRVKAGNGSENNTKLVFISMRMVRSKSANRNFRSKIRYGYILLFNIISMRQVFFLTIHTRVHYSHVLGVNEISFHAV